MRSPARSYPGRRRHHHLTAAPLEHRSDWLHPVERFWRHRRTLLAEGTGTRLLLERTGCDLDDHRSRDALDRMGPGWRDDVLPRLAALVGGRE